MSLRASAVPLIAVDPYFSISSFADRLTDDHTRHWTGRRNGMNGLIRVDGTTYRFMGLTEPFAENYRVEPDVIPQVSVQVYPLHSAYVFENEQVRLSVNFLTPLLFDQLHILSRPASYIYYDVEVMDGREHEISLYFDIAGECSIDTPDQTVSFSQTDVSVCCGNSVQNVLNRSGDDVRIDWGYLHLAHRGAVPATARSRSAFIETGTVQPVDPGRPYAYGEYPCIAAVSDKRSDMLCLAYDDVRSIEYFGKPTAGYYQTYYRTFDNMLHSAIRDFEDVKAKALRFEAELTAEMAAVDPLYAEIGALAFRQTIAAHKLIADENGDLVFLSKECFSNGCIATLDVTYPSIPLFIRYCPELVMGMLRPILRYAQSEDWRFEFAPHDCGQYPLCNGAVYGEGKRENQMPVEECGNMLICAAALCRKKPDQAFLSTYRDLFGQWADYLVQHGYDPDNQLCTDDFAGHLPHNCNLSLKAMVAIGAYGALYRDERYSRIAKEMAAKWVVEAAGREGTRLAFHLEDSWSLKYNMVWDKLLGLGLFDENVYRREIAAYKAHMNRYGVPLDCRKTYTKLDWLIWTTVMTEDEAYNSAVLRCVYDMIGETKYRVPIADWYDSVTADKEAFQNRSVLGGFYIHLIR